MELSGVGIRYGRRSPWILTGVSAELAPGTTAAVVGGNGAGKSTLLRAGAGLHPPDRGRISGRPSDVGWVPERQPVDQPFTVRSYLAAAGAVRGLGRRTVRARVAELVERLGCADFIDAALRELSFGTTRKVGLIQALLARPGLLVMDEPWDGLDADTQAELTAIITELTAAGGRCLIADHRGLVDTVADAWWVVAGGRVEVHDDPPRPDRSAEEREIIEIDVEARDRDGVVAWLRESGQHVVGVRRVGVRRVGR